MLKNLINDKNHVSYLILSSLKGGVYMNIFNFFTSRWETILGLTVEHFIMLLIAMVISILLGTTVGIIITMNRKLATIILNITNVMMTIPSLALFSLLIPHTRNW